jgi:ABC-type glycerol-3-phosphate transport system substrate-binding protein
MMSIRLKPRAWQIVAVCLSFLCGCPGTPATKPSTNVQPFRGQEVNLVVPKSLQLPALWEVTLQEWMSQTGATIRWSEYSESEQGSLEELISTPAEAGGRVILFPLRQLSQLDRHLAPITADCTTVDLKDLFKGLRDRVVSRNRTPVTIPISAPVMLCYYRADLLAAAGLKPPETWDDYQSLLDSLERWAPGLTAVEPLAPEHRATLFFARSLAYVKHPENYSVWFDLESGKPVLQSAGFEEAITVADRTWSKMPTSIASLTPEDCRNQVLEGKAALAIGVEPTIGTDRVTRADSIEIGVCRIPGSRRVFNPNSSRWDTLPDSAVHAPAICAFDGLAISVGASQADSGNAAAWHLLSMLVGDQFESNWAELPKSPCRESQTSTATSWHEAGLTVEEASQSVDAIALMLRDSQLVADLPLPDADSYRAATERVIGKLLSKEVDPPTALQLIQAEFEQIAKTAAGGPLRDNYRRGLGLPKLEATTSVRGTP